MPPPNGTSLPRPEQTTDARGLECPMPLVMAKTAMETLPRGEELLVMATDPEAAIDLAAWAHEQGHTLTERDAGGWMEFVLSRGR
ncbi:MAG: sulfurtransferase TusA family protein [Thermoleophilaceae bacterium]